MYRIIQLLDTGHIKPINFILDSAAVSVSDLCKSKDITLYPNPAKNTLQVQLPASFTNAQYRIFNATGNQLKNIQRSGNVNRLEIDDLQPGLYFMEIINLPTGERITSSFQKN